MNNRKNSELESRLVSPEVNANRFREELEKKVTENKTFNDNVLDGKESFDDKQIIDSNILIRSLKFTGEQSNDDLLLERKYTSFTTNAGKPGSKVEDWGWSSKAVIIKMPEQWYIDTISSPEIKAKYAQLKEGDEVWCHISTYMSTNYLFIHERNFPVEANQGYLSVPISAIQMKVIKK